MGQLQKSLAELLDLRRHRDPQPTKFARLEFGGLARLLTAGGRWGVFAQIRRSSGLLWPGPKGNSLYLVWQEQVASDFRDVAVFVLRTSIIWT